MTIHISSSFHAAPQEMKRRADEELGPELSVPLLLKADNALLRSHGLIWDFFQGFFSLCGGVTFVLGTGIYYFRVEHGAFLSALLYTIGSCCFVALDSQEIVASRKQHAAYRINMALNWIGSFLYLVGSIGFFPTVLKVTNQLSIQGFVWGSFCMGCSQIWKIHRLESSKQGFYFSSLFSSLDAANAFMMEFSAAIGAWLFFLGTVMLWHAPREQGPYFSCILDIWMIGSWFFTAGSCILIYRQCNPSSAATDLVGRGDSF